MKTILKFLFVIPTVLFFMACNGSKKEDQYGNKVSDEKSTTKTQATAYPLAEKGKELFDGKGTCATCHKLDSKLIGPSVQDIVTIYKEKNSSIAVFLNGESEPIVDPTQFEVMKANFAITKTFTDEERKALEEYFLSVAE